MPSIIRPQQQRQQQKKSDEAASNATSASSSSRNAHSKSDGSTVSNSYHNPNLGIPAESALGSSLSTLSSLPNQSTFTYGEHPNGLTTSSFYHSTLSTDPGPVYNPYWSQNTNWQLQIPELRLSPLLAAYISNTPHMNWNPLTLKDANQADFDYIFEIAKKTVRTAHKRKREFEAQAEHYAKQFQAKKKKREEQLDKEITKKKKEKHKLLLLFQEVLNDSSESNVPQSAPAALGASHHTEAAPPSSSLEPVKSAPVTQHSHSQGNAAHHSQHPQTSAPYGGGHAQQGLHRDQNTPPGSAPPPGSSAHHQQQYQQHHGMRSPVDDRRGGLPPPPGSHYAHHGGPQRLHSPRGGENMDPSHFSGGAYSGGGGAGGGGSYHRHGEGSSQHHYAGSQGSQEDAHRGPPGHHAPGGLTIQTQGHGMPPRGANVMQGPGSADSGSRRQPMTPRTPRPPQTQPRYMPQDAAYAPSRGMPGRGGPLPFGGRQRGGMPGRFGYHGGPQRGGGGRRGGSAGPMSPRGRRGGSRPFWNGNNYH